MASFSLDAPKINVRIWSFHLTNFSNAACSPAIPYAREPTLLAGSLAYGLQNKDSLHLTNNPLCGCLDEIDNVADFGTVGHLIVYLEHSIKCTVLPMEH